MTYSEFMRTSYDDLRTKAERFPALVLPPARVRVEPTPYDWSKTKWSEKAQAKRNARKAARALMTSRPLGTIFAPPRVDSARREDRAYSFWKEQRPGLMRKKRRHVLNKTGNHCFYCGLLLNLATMSVDHLIPRAKQGIDRITNLVAACHPCNTKKGDRAPTNAEVQRNAELNRRYIETNP